MTAPARPGLPGALCAFGKPCYPYATQKRGSIAMTIKTLLAALALFLSPELALANGCQWEKSAQQCGENQTFDAATGTCVDKATS